MQIPVTGRYEPPQKGLYVFDQAFLEFINGDCGGSVLRGNGDKSIYNARTGDGIPYTRHQVMQGNAFTRFQLNK